LSRKHGDTRSWGKITYKVKNWKQYNRSLINRGNLTLWVSEAASESWYSENEDSTGRGRRLIYSDACIELALTVRTLFRFPLRATQGFLEGLMQLMQLKLKVPHYSSLSRRAADLEIILSKKRSDEKLDLVISPQIASGDTPVPAEENKNDGPYNQIKECFHLAV
jgi:hypothetical protein